MTDLEIVLLIALAIVLFLYNRATRLLGYYKCAIVAVGLKQATVTVDETDKSFTIEIDYNKLSKRVSKIN
jgi:hypothetical protein